tara:strand:+ start:262 stop:1494 length:1233 start_codon:yes stop_codon:yes gene_type:complete
MSDNNEFKDAENCKDIIQHLHPINIDELKKYFKERKIITEPGFYKGNRNRFITQLGLPEEFEEKRSEDCDLNDTFGMIEPDDDDANSDDGEYHYDFSEFYKYVNPLTYLIVKNNSLKKPREKEDLEDAIDILVENGADINFDYVTVIDVYIFFNNSPFKQDLKINADLNILDIAIQVKNIVAIGKLLKYDELVIRKPFRHFTILGEIALLDKLDLFVQLIEKIEKTETIDIIDYTLNYNEHIKKLKSDFDNLKIRSLHNYRRRPEDREEALIEQMREKRDELKPILEFLIRAFKKMNHNSIPQEEQKKLLKYVGNDEELKTFLIIKKVMNKDIATYAKEQRRQKLISQVLSKAREEKIIKSIMDEYLGGKTKKRKNKKSKSHKNKTKGKKNKSKSKKKLVGYYDIYRMPY